MEETDKIDLSAATDTLKELVNALKDWVGDNATVLFGVAGAFVVFWVLRVGLRIIKSFTKA